MRKLTLFLLSLLLSSCIFFKAHLKDQIKTIIKEEYSVDVEVIDVKIAIQMGLDRYQYTAHLKDDPLRVFGGFYFKSKHEISKINMNSILFRHRQTEKIRQLFSEENIVVKLYTTVNSGIADYQNMELCDLNDPSTSNTLRIHTYRFVKEGEVVSLDYFQPIIDELEKLTHVRLSLVLTTYPDSLFNTEDLRSNNFIFGYEYSGKETLRRGFELDHFNEMINFFMVKKVSSEALLLEWEKALINEKASKRES